MRGCFITLEGGEGAGKSTQAALLADALTHRGISVEVTREPGGTPGAEAIRQLLLHPPDGGWLPRAEALLFAAARSDHVERKIRPALESGKWVVCDRFLHSSRAYQGYAGGLGDEAILTLHSIGSGDLRPDMTLLIEVDAHAVTRRLAVRDPGGTDAIGGRNSAYHAEVAEGFSAIARTDPETTRLIDGSGSPGEVHERIMDTLHPLLERQSSC